MERLITQAEFLRAVNSSPRFGTVITSHRVRKLRDEGAAQISPDGQRLDVIKVLAYLVAINSERRQRGPGGHEAKADKQIARERAKVKQAQEITIGHCADVGLREELRRDLERFCYEMFPDRFTLALSDDHRSVIRKAERAVLEGGLFAVAMPRGNGKTTICDATVLWAMLYGHRRFAAMIGAEQTAADERGDALRTELRYNDRLNALFPEICGPIRELDGTAQKRMRHGGELITLSWTGSDIMLPIVPNFDRPAPGAGGIIRCAGITGRIRGMNASLPTGESLRPDLVVIDDPQTDESAKSATQVSERMRVIGGAILGLAGPDKMISGIMPCTVIRPGDLADQVLTDGKFPEWDKARCQLVYQWPDREDLWEQYAEIVRDGDGDIFARRRAATQFVRDNFDEMHRGAVVGWKERYDRGQQVSALQYAYDWRIRDEVAFNAEAQQAPNDESGADGKLTEADILAKLNNRERCDIPPDTHKLTAFVDVSGDVLFYMVVAWTHDFTGYIVDYGTYPDQRSGWFFKSSIRFALDKAEPGIAGFEDALYRGLTALIDGLAGREWALPGGASKPLDRVLIDANWPQSTRTVYLFCRQSPHRAILYPAHGKFMSGEAKPFSQYKRTALDTPGLEWLIRRDLNRRDVPYVITDVNFWKSFVYERMKTSMARQGSLSLFGGPNTDHRLLLSHLTAEAFKADGEAAKGRRIEKWTMQPGRTENDWFDCLVGAAVAASIEGCSIHSQREAVEDQQAKKAWDAFLSRGRA